MSATIKTFVSVTVVVLVALLVGAASDRRATAFSIDISNNTPVTSLAPGSTLCQAGITAVAPFDAVVFWAMPVRALEVNVHRAGSELGTRLVRGPAPDNGQVTVPVGGTVPRGRRFTLCIRNDGPRRVVFEGGPGQHDPVSGVMSIDGRPQPSTIALLFLRSQPPSLLSLLPAVFDRAALFKLSWVGPWTFWLLLAALLGTFAVMGWALARALRDDEG